MILAELNHAKPTDPAIAAVYARALIESTCTVEDGSLAYRYKLAEDVLSSFDAEPSTVAIKCSHAMLLTCWGLDRRDRGNADVGLAMVRQAVNEMERLKDECADDASIDRQLSDSLYLLACGYDVQGEANLTVSACEQALLNLKLRAEHEPSNAFLRERQAVVQGMLGSSLMKQGSLEQGRDLSLTAVSELESLARDDPENFRPLREWGIACTELAEGLLACAQNEHYSIQDRDNACNEVISWSRKAELILDERRASGRIRQFEIKRYYDELRNLIDAANSELQSLGLQSSSEPTVSS